MKREDLRSKIIPTTIKNTNELYTMGNKKFDTTDFIYLDSYDEKCYVGQSSDGQHEERRILATDYALMNNAYAIFRGADSSIRVATRVWLRTAYDRNKVYCVNGLRKLYRIEKQ